MTMRIRYYPTRSSLRKQGPIRRGFSLGTMLDGFVNNQGQWLWVPAFAGTTIETNSLYAATCVRKDAAGSRPHPALVFHPTG